MVKSTKYTGEELKVFRLLHTIQDPEIPVINIVELGILRGIDVSGKELTVSITPTYSGCPALAMVEAQIKLLLSAEGYEVAVENVLEPAWSSDDIPAAAKKKMEEFGIAAPREGINFHDVASVRRIPCPQCRATETELISQFGSTSCKALLKCGQCQEPFEYFKCH